MTERNIDQGIIETVVENPGRLPPAVLMTLLSSCLLTRAYRRVILEPHEGGKPKVYSSIEVQRRLRQERELMGEICIQVQQESEKIIVQSSRPAHRRLFTSSF